MSIKALQDGSMADEPITVGDITSKNLNVDGIATNTLRSSSIAAVRVHSFSLGLGNTDVDNSNATLLSTDGKITVGDVTASNINASGAITTTGDVYCHELHADVSPGGGDSDVTGSASVVSSASSVTLNIKYCITPSNVVTIWWSYVAFTDSYDRNEHIFRFDVPALLPASNGLLAATTCRHREMINEVAEHNLISVSAARETNNLGARLWLTFAPLSGGFTAGTHAFYSGSITYIL